MLVSKPQPMANDKPAQSTPSQPRAEAPETPAASPPFEPDYSLIEYMKRSGDRSGDDVERC
jgi:hypothetical protein